MIESLLLAVTRVMTYSPDNLPTNATGFFFERDGQLFLVTNRHVVIDEPSGHAPDRIEIELHVDADNVAEVVQFSIPLYVDGIGVWREGSDTGGVVDVIVIALDRSALPEGLHLFAFTPDHLLADLDVIEAGAAVRIVGFPLGFHDTVHRLPVTRQAVVASAFGIRFQGSGFFLTDARMHRGTSGAPVVARLIADQSGRGDLVVWALLGIHASRFDVDNRDVEQDERLSLNCAWYADILLALTEPVCVQAPQPSEGEPATDTLPASMD